jgi:hypothetical protein
MVDQEGLKYLQEFISLIIYMNRMTVVWIRWLKLQKLQV